MKLVTKRHEPGLTCVIGQLLIDGDPFCNTLERLPSDDHPDIPAGTYAVSLTVSPEAVAGHLWSPSSSGMLPLLEDVPGRSGIRIHAGNTAGDSRGCIEVGHWIGGEFLSGSRPVLTALMEKLIGVDDITIEMVDL